MPDRGFRRMRLMAALTFAGVAGLAGGALPSVVADDAPTITTTVAGTPCPDSPLVDGQIVTVADGEQCPTTGTTDETPPPTTGETPPPTYQRPPPPQHDPPAATDAAPPSSDAAAPGDPAHPAQAPATQTSASAPARPTATRQPESQAVKGRRTETKQKAAKDPAKDRPPAHRPATTQRPLHASPYGALAMHWTVRDPLGLNDFPTITVAAFPVPPFLLPIYQAAGAEYDIHWEILAAINEVETGFGSNLRESSAGAVGWMQFMPATWARYGVDADGDGKADPWNPVDAIFAAARYLHASGAESSLPDAIWAYNHAGWYVDQVIDRARTFAGLPDDLVAVLTREGFADTKSVHARLGKDSYVGEDVKLTMPGQALLLSDKDLRRRVLADDNVSIYACGREDIEAGRIDARVLATLEYLRLSHFDPSVSALECGHSFLTSSGNVSEHSSGDAVDIPVINGTAVLGNQGPGSITDDVVRRLLRLQGLMKPHQIITLMTYPGTDNTFSMPDHANHVHVGFRPMAPGR